MDQQTVPAVPDTNRSQVVERVAQILAGISHGGSQGRRLKDLALETGIARPSVHRLLQELMQVGFVVQKADRTYALGPQLFTLGLSAPSPVRDLAGLRQLAQALADECGDVVYVALKQFDGVRYLIRAEGEFPIRTHTVVVGDVKPFSSSYSGLALLAHMSEEEQQVQINRLALDAPREWADEHRNALRRQMREKLQEVRQLGYCSGQNVVMPGVAGIAACIPSLTSAPYMTVSISAVEYRLDAARVAEIAPRLLRTASAMQAFIL